MSDNNLRLLGGKPAIFDENGLIHSPTLSEVADIGESKYNEYLSLMLFDKSSISAEIKEDAHDFELLYVLTEYDDKFRERLFSAYQFFFKQIPTLEYTNEGVFFLFSSERGKWRIDKNNFFALQDIIEFANNVKKPKKEEYKPVNKKAKELLEKLRSFPVPKKKEEITLFSIVNSLAWRNNGINIQSIFDLTVYQIYQAFFTTEKIDNYLFTIQGLYAGTVDSKKINLSKIHWAKEIKN